MKEKNIIFKKVFFDFETRHNKVEDKAELMVWALKEEDKELFLEWSDAKGFVDYLEKNYLDNGNFYYMWAHNFAKFDSTYFIREIERRVKEKGKSEELIKEELNIFQEDNEDKNIYLPNKKVYTVRWKNINFLCSWLLFRTSLKSLMKDEEKAVKEDKNFNWQDDNIWVDKEEEITRYLINDVLTLERVMLEHFARFPWSVGYKTLASMALKHATMLNKSILFNGTMGRLYNRSKKVKVETDKINLIKERAYEVAKEASKGTCVNYWNTRFGTYETLTNIDVNSMYADRYRNMPMPWGIPIIYKDGEVKGLPEIRPLKDCPKDFFGFVVVEFDGWIKDELFPFVISSKRHPESSKNYETGYYFPKHLKGTFTWFSPWFDFIRDNYVAKDNKRLFKIREKHHYQKNYPFRKYADFWIKEKNIAKGLEDEGRYRIAKGMLNALYGKFGQDIFNKQGKLRNCFNYQPILSAILAYARVKLYSAINNISRKYGKETLLYSDTDSIFTTLSRQQLSEVVELDDYKLGAWKCKEYNNVKFNIFAPKAYSLEILENGMIIVRWKGIDCEKAELPQYIIEILDTRGFVLLPTITTRVMEDGRIIEEIERKFYLNQYRKKIDGNKFIEWEE